MAIAADHELCVNAGTQLARFLFLRPESGPTEQNMGRIKIALSDDHSIVRQLLKEAIDRRDGWVVVGTAANGLELLDMRTHEVLYANPFTKALLGDIEHELCWRVLREGRDGPCPSCDNHRLIDRSGAPTGATHWKERIPADRRWYQCTAVAHPTGDGQVVKLVNGVAIDDEAAAQRLASSRFKRRDNITVMCQNCHHIRDIDQLWHSPIPLIEEYLDADVSMGVCPECIKRFYAEYFENSAQQVG